MIGTKEEREKETSTT